MIVDLLVAPIVGMLHVMALMQLVMLLAAAFSLGMLLMWAVLSAGFLAWWRRIGAATVASSTATRPDESRHGVVEVPLAQPRAA